MRKESRIQYFKLRKIPFSKWGGCGSIMCKCIMPLSGSSKPFLLATYFRKLIMISLYKKVPYLGLSASGLNSQLVRQSCLVVNMCRPNEVLHGELCLILVTTACIYITFYYKNLGNYWSELLWLRIIRPYLLFIHWQPHWSSLFSFFNQNYPMLKIIIMKKKGNF